MTTILLIVAAIALATGIAAGYLIFCYVIKGKYKGMLEAANKEADVIKEFGGIKNLANEINSPICKT